MTLNLNSLKGRNFSLKKLGTRIGCFVLTRKHLILYDPTRFYKTDLFFFPRLYIMCMTQFQRIIPSHLNTRTQTPLHTIFPSF